MKWTMVNAFAGSAWLAGLWYAKGTLFPQAGLLGSSDHHLLVGMAVCAASLALLLWTNIRSTV